MQVDDDSALGQWGTGYQCVVVHVVAHVVAPEVEYVQVVVPSGDQA